MNIDNKTVKPSKSSVISKPITSKLPNKMNSQIIIKPKNNLPIQSTLRRTTNTATKIPSTSTSTLSTNTLPTHSSSPAATSMTPSNDINNPRTQDNEPLQNTRLNYASAVANENTPSRDQALVFNSIDGIPQRDYIVAVGNIISPKNIVFVSRISNNRFCIFLASKQILDSLLESNPTITINEQTIQIRRLINPSKRIVISNVCPSIPNQVIYDALKNINITPMSQIVYLKAGINIDGYDHILSFRRQFYIKHEDASKLPVSLSLLYNQTDFRVFFTDDRIICFLCKSTGHTSNTCKKNDTSPLSSTQPMETDLGAEPFTSPHTLQDITEKPTDIPTTNYSGDNSTQPDTPDDSWSAPKNPATINLSSTVPVTLTQEGNGSVPPPQISSSPDTNLYPEDLHQHTQIATPDTSNQHQKPTSAEQKPIKRHLSDSSSLETNNIVITTLDSTTPIPCNDLTKKTQKKAKINVRSNSSSSLEDKILEGLRPANEYFSNSPNSPSVSVLQFKYILDNYTNKNINIHNLCKEIDSDIPSLMKLIDEIRPKITKTFLKTHLTKLGNLLFQASPPQDS